MSVSVAGVQRDVNKHTSWPPGSFRNGQRSIKEMSRVQPTIACYRDHADAGSVLTAELRKYAGQNVAVFGIGAGGVAVAAPVARALGADLDVLAARRLTLPGQPDRVWGAVAALGEYVQIVADQATEGRRHAAVEPEHSVRHRDLAELRQLENSCRSGRPPERVSGRLVIVVADGVTNLTVMRAAASAIRRHHPARMVFALPAGTTQECRELRNAADEVICPLCVGLFHATAPVYSDRASVGIDDVRRWLTA
jgi:predicted phosphoribosyltransferase